MKLYLFCRKCLQHPCVSLVVGHVSLQPPNMFCQTYQRHDDKNWKAHWRQRQDLLALFTRLEKRKCGLHTVLRAGTVPHWCGFNMLTCRYAHLLLIGPFLCQIASVWPVRADPGHDRCVWRGVSCVFSTHYTSSLPKFPSHWTTQSWVKTKIDGCCALRNWEDLLKEPR